VIVLRDCRTASVATASSTAATSPNTAASSTRDRRAGSVTMRTNQSAAATGKPGQASAARSFQYGQSGQTCSAPRPARASWLAPTSVM
jgi:hypothetical protein